MIAQAITITNLAGCGREARRIDVRKRTQKSHRKGGKAIHKGRWQWNLNCEERCWLWRRWETQY